MSDDFAIVSESKSEVMVYRNPYINTAAATYGTTASEILNPSSFFHLFPIAATTTAVVTLPDLRKGDSYYFRGYITNTAAGTMAFKPATAIQSINSAGAGANYVIPTNSGGNARHVAIVGDSKTLKWYISAVAEL